MKGQECEHEDVKLEKVIANTHLCFECGGNLVCNEIEVFNSFYEVGAFCDNDKCRRYMILVA